MNLNVISVIQWLLLWLLHEAETVSVIQIIMIGYTRPPSIPTCSDGEQIQINTNKYTLLGHSLKGAFQGQWKQIQTEQKRT